MENLGSKIFTDKKITELFTSRFIVQKNTKGSLVYRNERTLGSNSNPY